MRYFLVAAVISFHLISPEVVVAQSQARVDRIEEAWKAFMSSNRVSRAAIAISFEGRLVRETTFGTSRETRFPLASLSKAITGACIRKLISSKRINEKTTIEEIFSGEFAGARITVGQLLTHTSGLAPDSTQKDMHGWLNSTKVRHEQVARKALGRANQIGSPGKYLYNNENYAILGAIIEKVTSRPYAQFCTAAVLKPVGISSGRLSGKWGALAAWGGWEMSVSDYAKFVAGNFGNDTQYGSNPGRWPNTSLGGGAKYGLGTLYRKSGSRYNFWHFGAHCFGSNGSAGSFFAVWQGKWSVVTAYNSCLSDRQMELLDSQLANSALK